VEHFLLILGVMAVLIIFATAIGKDAGEMNREHGRNLELEHKLGGQGSRRVGMQGLPGRQGVTAPNCPHCNRYVETWWMWCPWCGASLR